LTDWPLDRLRRTRRAARYGNARPPASSATQVSRTPFVLTETTAHGLRLAALNHAAKALGLSPGLGFADARARVPALLSEEIDRGADAKALKALAAWMIRFSPLVALDGPDGLLLETTGCDHLHGGEVPMTGRISEILTREGISHAIGLAGTVGAASALARGRGGGIHILPSGEEQDGLAALPVGALRISAEAGTILRRFGLGRIGQLYGIERASLARRFASTDIADAVLARLDQALGRRAEPLVPFREPARHQVRLPCPEPIGSTEGVAAGLSTLAAMICGELEREGRGARRFTFHAFRSDGEVSSTQIATARPVRAPAHLERLFGEKLDRIDPGFGIDLMLLEAHRVGPMSEADRPLSAELTGGDLDEAALCGLADRITARLGERAVSVHTPRESHIPERSEREEAFEGSLAGAHSPLPRGERPARLFASPEPVRVMAEVPDGPPLRFVWRRVPRRVMRAEGPERIGPEWWRLDDRQARTRDYYRIEDEEGKRYWLFREGLYEDGPTTPEWYVHGLFV
jgi:protein ImuB